MAKDALVDSEIEEATRLVSFLDNNGLKVSGALWLYQSDAERWRFLVSFDEHRQNITSYYLEVAKLIKKYGAPLGLLDLSSVEFVDANRSVIGPLSQAIKVAGLSRVRLSSSKINGVFLEDALIYRLAA
jgi:predicted methyltransferase MtxX (methanogen marker protein 4)